MPKNNQKTRSTQEKSTKKSHRQSWTVPNIPPAIRPVHSPKPPQNKPKPESSKPKPESPKPQADKPKK